MNHPVLSGGHQQRSMVICFSRVKPAPLSGLPDVCGALWC